MVVNRPRIVLKYYLYQATVTFGFFWPVFTIFLLYRDLSYTQIALLNSLSAAVVVVGEIPTGYLGDRIGRRNSLVAGSVLITLSIFGFVFARSFAGFVFIWILWAFGQAFRSGSGDAWLYETLEDRLDEQQYTRVRGRGGSVNMWVSAATMLAAGVLYDVRPVLPFVAAGVLNSTAVAVLLSMPKTRQFVEEDPSDDAFSILDALPLIKRRLTEPPLRSFVLYVAVFFGVIRAADEYIQPITVNMLNFPEAALGPLYASFTVLSGVASYYAGDVEDALSTRWSVVVVPLVLVVFLFVPMFVPLVALPAFFVIKSAQTVMKPIASGYVNDHAESVGRATVLSAVSMVYALVRLPLQPIGGVVADAMSPVVAFAALGGLLLGTAVLVYVWEAPATDATERAGQPAD
ncbi:MFS transporter [Halorussus ruber]|uniref:MFS transporter n=1 Tax=Halorussus ruber TaxID=1126238 RepID=UPI0010930232|nr:MFS transporter [Halorussus ruber]